DRADPEAGAELPRRRRGIGDDREMDLGEARERPSVSRPEPPGSEQRDAEAAGRPQPPLPPAATRHTTSTRSPRTPTSSSTMLETTQQWFGTTLTTSPTAGRSRHCDRFSTPCSSESPVITASGYSSTCP